MRAMQYNNKPGAAIYLTRRQMQFLSRLLESTIQVTEDASVLRDARRIRNKVVLELEAEKLANQKQH